MFTRKTRVMSAVLTVCMLISMLACFVIPAAATTTDYTGELVSETGLADVRKLDDIKDGLKTDVKTYKVTDRAGFEKISDLVAGGNALTGYTFTMANDVDFQWKNFRGIGDATYPFAGVFDGNGFVVEKLLIAVPAADCVGLFGRAGAGFVVKNLGIASGFVVGGKKSGALVGWSSGANITVYNCWNAATVFTTEDAGIFVGALQSSNASKLYNCYNLGLGINGFYGGALYGTANNNYLMSVKNTYNFGQFVADVRETNQISYAAFGRSRLTAGSFSGMANNAYLKQDLGFVSHYEHIAAGGTTTKDNDQAMEFTRDEFTGTEIITRLNTDMAAEAVPAGYTIAYEAVEGVDYPVLTYYKDGAAVIRRVAHTDYNIGENTLAKDSDFFAKYCANIDKFPNDSLALGEITIDSPEDLVALSLMITSREGRGINKDAANRYTGLGITKISFAADIDMADCKVFAGPDGKGGLSSFLPIGAGNGANFNSTTKTSLNVPVAGNGHVIKNWHSYTFTTPSTDAIGALFVKMDSNASITDLGMENAVAEYDVRETASTDQHTRYALMVGKIAPNADASKNATIENCWATGAIKVHKISGSTGVSTQDFGGLVARDIATDKSVGTYINNCWVDVDVENAVYPTYTKATVIGVNGTVDNMSNNFYFADDEDILIGTAAMAADQTKLSGETAAAKAWALNQIGLKDSADNALYWGVNAAGNTTWVASADQIYKVGVVATKANNQEFAAFGKAGDTVNLNTLLDVENATYTAASGSVGDLAADGTFTFGAGNGSYTTDVSMVSDTDFLTVKGIYEKNKEFWDIKDSTIGTDLNAIATGLANETYAEQATLNTAVKAVAAKFVVTAEDKIPASMNLAETTLDNGYVIAAIADPRNSTTYLKVGIYNETDLLSLETKASGNYAGQTVYLCTNLDLKNSAFKTLPNLRAGFDGLDHTVKNYAPQNMYGFLQSYDGPFVKNVTFDYDAGVQYVTVGKAAGILMNNYQQNVAGGAGEISNVTIRNAQIVRSGIAPEDSKECINFAPIVFEMTAADINFSNITVENCTLTQGTDKNNNNSFFVGRPTAGTKNFKDITIRNNKYIGNSDSAYFAVEVANSTGTNVNVENLVIANNKREGTGRTYVIFNEFFSNVAEGKAVHNVTFKNTFVYNNDATCLMRYRLRMANTLTAENVYTDIEAIEFSECTPPSADIAGFVSMEQTKDFGTDTVVESTENFQNGKVAYDFNKVVGDTVLTVQNNDLAYVGAASDIIYKLSITATADGTVYDAYGKTGETVDLKALLNMTELDDAALVAADGNKGTIANNVFTFGEGDDVYTTALKLVNPADYDTLAALYAAYPAVYGDAAKAKLDAIKDKLDAEEYAGQVGLDADIAEAAAFFAINKAETIVPVTMSREATTLNCGIALDAVKDVYNDTSYLQLGIYTAKDLEMLAHGPNNGLAFAEGHYSANQTVHLMADLDLAESSFLRIHGLNANFDGHNHTITNFNAATSAFVPYFRGKTFKNLHFENCHTKASQDSSAFFLYGTTGATVTNVSFENCSVTKNGKKNVAFFAGQLYEKMTAKDIVIRNCEVKGEDELTAGFLVGGLDARSWYGHTSTIENLVVDGCTLNAVTADSGFVVLQNQHGSGALTTANGLAVKNMILSNCTVTGANKANFVTGTEGAAYNANFENVVAYNNTAFADYTNTTGTNTNVQTGANAGEAAYKANANLDAALFTVKDGDAKFIAEGEKAPFMVTFDGDTDTVYYTDKDGKLTATADELDALTDCTIKDGETTVTGTELAAKVFEDDATYTVKAHDYEFVKKDNAQHTATCKNCSDTYDEAHNDEGDAVAGGAVTAPGEDNEGYTEHTCTVCNNTWQTDFVAKVPTLKTGKEYRLVADSVDVPVALKNMPADLKAVTVTVTYSGTAIKNPQIKFAEGLTVNIVQDADGILKVEVSSNDPLVNRTETVGGLNALFVVTFAPGDEKGQASVSITAEGGDRTITAADTKVFYTDDEPGNFDASGDGLASMEDARLMLQYVVGYDLTNVEHSVAKGDMNGDGVINMRDVVLLLRRLAANA